MRYDRCRRTTDGDSIKSRVSLIPDTGIFIGLKNCNQVFRKYPDDSRFSICFATLAIVHHNAYLNTN